MSEGPINAQIRLDVGAMRAAVKRPFIAERLECVRLRIEQARQKPCMANELLQRALGDLRVLTELTRGE